MIRVAAFAAALAAALAAGSQAPAKVEGRLFGLLGTQGGQFVVEVDPATLQPLAGRRLRLAPAGPGAPWTVDPGRHTLAIARGERLRLIDLPRLRPAWSLKLSSRMVPSGILWLRDDRIVVLVHAFQRYETIVVDPTRRRVVARRSVSDGSIEASARTESEVVILRAPTSGIGPANVLVVDGAGDIQEIPLPRILAGWERDANSVSMVGTQNRPALALDRERRIAYVVAPDGVVAEVPLGGDGVRYHTVHGRFAKFVSGSARRALVMNGKIVVTGDDSTTWTLPDGKPAMRTDPAGLEIIDPLTWQARRIAENVAWITPWERGFLATGGAWSSLAAPKTGLGVALYDADGTERLRVLDGKRMWVAAVYGQRAYLYAEGEEVLRIVDLDSGQVLDTRQRQVPWLLVEQNAPVW